MECSRSRWSRLSKTCDVTDDDGVGTSQHLHTVLYKSINITYAENVGLDAVCIDPERGVGVLQRECSVTTGVERKQCALLRLFCRACEDGAAQAVWGWVPACVVDWTLHTSAPCVGISTPAQCCKLVLWSLSNAIGGGIVVDGVVVLRRSGGCVMVALWHLDIPHVRSRFPLIVEPCSLRASGDCILHCSLPFAHHVEWRTHRS